uniref:F-box domain-containing protein n=1 Tax=Rhizophora mucronata TaxID=61149 RepID=A0A2P2QKZ6_RHIMU
MEVIQFVKHSEHEDIDKSMQNLTIIPPFVSHLSCRNDCQNQASEPGPPHEAIFFVLAYLPVFELLALSEVCRSLRDAVNKDVLPWLDVFIEKPLSSRLSDEALLRIASKAKGKLRTLALINCGKITDDGLRRVIEKNEFISKLHIPACTGLSPQGIIRVVKMLTQHHNSLNSLQIDGIYNLKKEHLETLSSHLRPNLEKQKPQPIHYHCWRNQPTSRNEGSCHTVDVEVCPRCGNVRMVFDCTKESCKKRNPLSMGCRGCNFCIPRCEECGRCVDMEELEEAICADILCSDCWLHLAKCNLCNNPYCKRHANLQSSPPSSAGFICDVCQIKAKLSSSYDAE